MRTTPIYVHLAGAAVASALIAYWGLRLAAPAAPVLAVAPGAVPVRDPDTRLAARLFGDVASNPGASTRNVQVSGVFSAGRDSSAVLAIDGKSPRAFFLGQEVFAGARLVEVAPDSVSLEQDGVRTQYAAPVLAVARSSEPTATFRREGGTLTAPSQDAPAPGARPNFAPRFGGADAPGRGLLSPGPAPMGVAGPGAPQTGPVAPERPER